MSQDKVAVIVKQLLIPLRNQYQLFKKELIDTFQVLQDSCIYTLHGLIQKLLKELSYYKSQNQGLAAILDHMKRTHSAQKNYFQIIIKEKEQQLLKYEAQTKQNQNYTMVAQMQRYQEQIDYNKETETLKKYLSDISQQNTEVYQNQLHSFRYEPLQTINEVTQSSIITDDLNLQCSLSRNNENLQHNPSKSILKTITNIINNQKTFSQTDDLVDFNDKKMQKGLITQFSDPYSIQDTKFIIKESFSKQLSNQLKRETFIARIDSPIPNLQIIRPKPIKVILPHTIFFDKNYKYVGRISDKKLPQGFGTLYRQQVIVYSGEWHQGQFCGWGQLFSFADSNIKAYHGKFYKGTPQGSGTVFYKNGGKFIGILDKGSINGQGKYITFEGQTIHAYWQNGHLKALLQRQQQ